MGQNNDVCWTFTNVMADVQDLFVERVEGDSYLFEDEWRPLEVVARGDPGQGPRPSPSVLEVRSTHHGPIVNDALGADDAEPLALRWLTLDEPTAFAACSSCSRIESGPDLVARLEGHTLARFEPDLGRPRRLDRLQDDRPAAAAPGGCPDLPKPGWTGEFEWEGTIPYEELPELVDPESGFLVTANNRTVGDDYPHHITSEWFDGFRAKRIEELLQAGEEHDLDDFEAMQTDVQSIPGLDALRPPGRVHDERLTSQMA